MDKSKLPFLGQSGIASADASRVPHIQAKKEQVRSRSQEIGWLLWALQYVFFIGVALFVSVRCGSKKLTPLRERRVDLHQTACSGCFYVSSTPKSKMPRSAPLTLLFSRAFTAPFSAKRYAVIDRRIYTAGHFRARHADVLAHGIVSLYFCPLSPAHRSGLRDLPAAA